MKPNNNCSELCGGTLESPEPLESTSDDTLDISSDEKQIIRFFNSQIFSFKDLFVDFIAGTPIKRKQWKGYWKYRYGRIEMHCKDGEVVDFLNTNDVLFTIAGILENDWEIATPENCEMLKK